MPSSMLPRSSGKPICGQRLSSAKTRPPSYMRSIGRWRPCTTSRPLAFNSSRLPALTKSKLVVYIPPHPRSIQGSAIQQGRYTNVKSTCRSHGFKSEGDARRSTPCSNRAFSRSRTSINASAKSRNDVLCEQLDLAHLLLPRHEALIEEPAEPFEFAFAAEGLQLLDLPFYLVDGASERIFGFAEPLNGPLGLRQHRWRRISFGVPGQPKRLGETKAAEIMVKAGIIGVAEQRHCLLLGAAEMHRAESADALAEPEIAAILRRYLAIKPTQAQKIGRIGNEDPRDNTRLRGIADRILADRERLKQRRMGVLVGPRHDTDLAHHALIIDFAGSAVSPGPFGDRPALDAVLVGERDLVVFAIVVPSFLSPGFFDDLEGLLVNLAVMVVVCRAVHRGAGNVVLLTEYIYPPVLVATGEPGVDTALGQVVQYGEFLCGP